MVAGTSTIEAPGSLLYGMQVVLPSSPPKVVADSYLDAKLEILDAAHLSPVEETLRFVALLETFLRENV
jgi:3-oxoadipate enol-lactonase